MCTLSYFPVNQNSFVITSNRDEAPHRAATEVKSLLVNGQTVIFPADREAGGTWIAASSENRIVCVLNGAFVKHQHHPPYRRSRGLMALDYFFFDSPADFFKSYAFSGMEPFTFLIFEKGTIWDARFDGRQLFTKERTPDIPLIWSSVTLYDKYMREQRRQWFATWLQENAGINQKKLTHFHLKGGVGDPWIDYVMNRNNIVKTVSITSIVQEPSSVSFCFQDLHHTDSNPINLNL